MFGKKITLDDILKGIDNLSDEEKEKVRDKMADLYKAEDEREIDKVEREKAETDEKADEKGEEEDEESEEIGKDVDEIEDDFDEENEKPEKTETPAAPTETEEDPKEDNAKMFAAIAERLDRIEAALGESMRNPKEADKKTSEELTALERTALERKYAF